MEALALATGLAPTPVLDTLMAAGLARTLMVASRLGIFDALEGGGATAAEVAARCDTDPAATRRLLVALAGAGYLTEAAGRYALAPVSRRWLLGSAPASQADFMDLMFVAWRWLEHYESYVRTGRSLDVHELLDEADWARYQRGMKALARLSLREVTWRTPLPRDARDMLDVGGAHGLYSVGLCRRQPGLRATVLELPEAIDHAAPLLAEEALGERVRHLAGDARTHDFGEARYDLVLVSNLTHHFDAETNRAMFRRLKRALRPGGVLVVQDMMRPRDARDAGAAGALGDLYFGALSAAGTWSFGEVAQWQAEVGLEPAEPVRFVTAPGLGQQAAHRR